MWQLQCCNDGHHVMQTALWHKHAPHSHTDTHVTQVPPRDSAMPGRTKLYPVTAALHEFSLVSHRAPQVSLQMAAPSLGTTRLHFCWRKIVGVLLLLLLPIFLPAPDHGSPDTSQSQSGGVSPDTRPKIRQVLLINSPLGDGEGIRPDMA